MWGTVRNGLDRLRDFEGITQRVKSIPCTLRYCTALAMSIAVIVG